MNSATSHAAAIVATGTGISPREDRRATPETPSLAVRGDGHLLSDEPAVRRNNSSIPDLAQADLDDPVRPGTQAVRFEIEDQVRVHVPAGQARRRIGPPIPERDRLA